MLGTRPTVALLASLGLHALLLTQALARRTPIPSVARPAEVEPTPAPVWPGETFDIDALTPPSDPAPSDPAPAAPSDPAPVPAPAPAAAAPTRPEEGAPAPAVQPGATSSPGSPAAYGQSGLFAVAAPIGKGLLRVLPRVAYVDPTFHDLRSGSTGHIRFQVDLDAEGRPTLPLGFDDDRSRARWLEPIVERAILLLRGGTFSQPPTSGGARSAAFELSFEIAEGQAASDDWLEPRDLAEIGRLIEPTTKEPGRAHFRYNSGREVFLTLRLVDPERDR